MKEIDHKGTANPVCPWCGTEHCHASDWEGFAGEHECVRCGKEFSWERVPVPEYTTQRLVTCRTCGRRHCKLRKDGVSLIPHTRPGTWEPCPTTPGTPA